MWIFARIGAGLVDAVPPLKGVVGGASLLYVTPFIRNVTVIVTKGRWALIVTQRDNSVFRVPRLGGKRSSVPVPLNFLAGGGGGDASAVGSDARLKHPRFEAIKFGGKNF